MYQKELKKKEIKKNIERIKENKKATERECSEMKRDEEYPRSYCLIIALLHGVINYDTILIIFINTLFSLSKTQCSVRKNDNNLI